MGIDYDTWFDTWFGYGLCFSFEEIAEAVRKHERDLFTEIGCDIRLDHSIENVWCEAIGYTTCPYFDADAKDIVYIIGFQMKHPTMAKISEFDTEIEDKRIKEICEHYGLEYRQPELVLLPNVW